MLTVKKERNPVKKYTNTSKLYQIYKADFGKVPQRKEEGESI